MRDELRTRLQTWMQELTLDPLDPTDHRYVALDKGGRASIDEIHATIDLELNTTTQLLSGPRGSGKTTGLRRLLGHNTSRDWWYEVHPLARRVLDLRPIDPALKQNTRSG